MPCCRQELIQVHLHSDTYIPVCDTSYVSRLWCCVSSSENRILYKTDESKLLILKVEQSLLFKFLSGRDLVELELQIMYSFHSH